MNITREISLRVATPALLLGLTIGSSAAQGPYGLLHNCDPGGTYTTGSMPYGALAYDKAGNMYGVCFEGGLCADGVVWEITTAGEYKDLHDFGAWIKNADGFYGPDGWNPISVTIDSAGNLYGSAYHGGPNRDGIIYGAGMVWKLSPAGVYTDLHDFGGLATNGAIDGYGSGSTVKLDSKGNLYGTCSGGGPYGKGIVWEISSSGYSVLHAFGGTIGENTADGSAPAGSVTFDSAGNMFGTATYGGANAAPDSDLGAGMIWEITKAGVYEDVHDFGGKIDLPNGTPTQDGFFPGTDITFDAAGNSYGTTNGGGLYNRGIAWKNKGGKYFDLHDFAGTVTNANGTSGPDGFVASSVTVDAQGNCFGSTALGGQNYVSGGNGGIVWEITSAGTYRDLHDFLALGGTTAGPDGSAPRGGVYLDGFGNLYGTASYGGVNGTGVIWAMGNPNLALKNISVSPSVLNGGSSSVGAVTLGIPAPIGGELVSLASSSTAVSLPASVLVAWGQTSASFAINTDAVAARVIATLTASINGKSQTTTLTVRAPALNSLTLNPTSVTGGSPSTATVAIGSPAPVGGLTIALYSNSGAAKIPSTVTIASGQTSATFTVTTSKVTAQATATIKAVFNGVAETANLTLTP